MTTKRLFTMFALTLVLALGTSAQAVSIPSGLWGVDVDVAIPKAVGPAKHYTGSFLFSGDALGGVGGEILKGADNSIVSASFTWKGVTYNNAKAKAKFFNGELIGLNFIFKINGKPQQFQIKMDKFLVNGVVKGAVSYDDSAYALALAQANQVPADDDTPINSVPTPAAVTGGLAMLAALGFRRRSAR